jgi:transcriptional/translational regulatory protein YebC/TACO1
MGYRPKEKTALTPEKKASLEAFLEALDDHDDTHRVYAAI